MSDIPDIKLPNEVIHEMKDVPRKHDYKARRNWQYHGRVLMALRELGHEDHIFPHDFWRRHWEDQKLYFECVMNLYFCTRCKMPVDTLDGNLCPGCSMSNKESWALSAEEREQRFQASLPTTLQSRKHRQYLNRKSRANNLEELREDYAKIALRSKIGTDPAKLDYASDVLARLQKPTKKEEE